MEENIFYQRPNKRPMDHTQWNVPIAFDTDADDYNEREIDLNEQLIKNKPATFFMRVNSDAMADAGIHSGDVVIVDRSIEPKNGKVIIALLDGEMLIRRLQLIESKKMLVPATKKLSAIEINDRNRFYVWGVVTFVIHSL